MHSLLFSFERISVCLTPHFPNPLPVALIPLVLIGFTIVNFNLHAALSVLNSLSARSILLILLMFDNLNVLVGSFIEFHANLLLSSLVIVLRDPLQ